MLEIPLLEGHMAFQQWPHGEIEFFMGEEFEKSVEVKCKGQRRVSILKNAQKRCSHSHHQNNTAGNKKNKNGSHRERSYRGGPKLPMKCKS